MKYFLICDFSTMSCDKSKVAEILSEAEIDFVNHNNFFWELDVPDTVCLPTTESTAETIHYLFHNYIDKSSFLLVVKADEHYPIEYLGKIF